MQVESGSKQSEQFFLPDIWHTIIPTISYQSLSYRDLVNLFVLSKFGTDISQTKNNFEVAKRIWCRSVSLITFIDTLLIASIKKANDAFFSIINIRADICDAAQENKNECNQFEKELLTWLNSLLNPPTSDDIDKIIKIAIKAGYLEVLEKCLSLQPREPLDLLKYALFEGNSKVIPIIAGKVQILGIIDRSEIISQWKDFLTPDTEKNIGCEFADLEKIISTATRNRFRNENLKNDSIVIDDDETTVSSEVIDLNYKIIIITLILKYDNKYPVVWMKAIEESLTVNQESRAIKIFRDTPRATFKKEFLHCIVNTNSIEFLRELSQWLMEEDCVSLLSTVIDYALIIGRKEIIQNFFDIIKEKINSDLEFTTRTTLYNLRRKLPTFTPNQTEAGCQLKENLKKCIPLIYRNAYITRKVLFRLSSHFPRVQDPQLSDFNLLRPLKPLKSDPDGKPLLCEDTGNHRIYIYPENKSFILKSLEVISVQSVFALRAIITVAEQTFNLLKAVLTADLPKMKASVIGIGITPIAFFGMGVGLLAHFIFPERGSKLYYACEMSLNAFVPSHSRFSALAYEPNFLYRPVPLES